MFQQALNYTMIYAPDGTTGVYGYFNGNKSVVREYLYNYTFPLLFNQDVVLKSMIDNSMNVINQKSNSTEGCKDFLLYVCFVLKISTMGLCLGYFIFKLIAAIKNNPQK
jgi:hypothetical protein